MPGWRLGGVLTLGLLAAASPGPADAAPINRDLFGVSFNFANFGQPLQDPAIQQAMRRLQVPHTRFVGGTPLSFWEWEPGRFIPESEIRAIWSNPWLINNGAHEYVNRFSPGLYTPAAMQDFARDARLQHVVWGVNITTRAADGPALIQHLNRDLDATARYFEMDNEAFFWQSRFVGLAGGQTYMTALRPTADAIRSEYPNARIGVCMDHANMFVSEPPPRSNTRKGWNDKISLPRNAADYDALVLHHYQMEGGRLDEFAGALDDVKRGFLAFPEVSLHRAANRIERLHNDKPMWITEFNVRYDRPFADTPQDRFIAGTANTGWNALYQAGFILFAMQHPSDIEMLSLHSLAGGNGWGLVEPISGSAARINATGQIYSHLNWIARIANRMERVQLRSRPGLGIRFERSGRFLAAVEAIELRASGRTWVVAINRDARTQRLRLPALGAFSQLRAHTYRADDPGATGYRRVDLRSGKALWQQSNLPLSPTLIRRPVTPDAPLDLDVPAFSLTVVELFNP